MKKTVAWILTAAVTASLLSGCTPEPAPTESPQPTGQVETEGTYIPGSYTATAKGYGGDVSVTVTVDADAITQVTVDAPDETADIGGKAAETLESAIMEAQSAQVDGVSGATFTSDAVKEAAERALLEATGQGRCRAGRRDTAPEHDSRNLHGRGRGIRRHCACSGDGQ